MKHEFLVTFWQVLTEPGAPERFGWGLRYQVDEDTVASDFSSDTEMEYKCGLPNPEDFLLDLDLFFWITIPRNVNINVLHMETGNPWFTFHKDNQDDHIIHS